MSNLTQFIKDGQIRDPKQLPIMVVIGSYDLIDAYGFMMAQETTISAREDYTSGTYTPFRDNAHGYRNNVAFLDVPTGTSYSTILNITGGGGYLCNVQNTRTEDYGGREQGLRITVDGVVTTYPAFSYDDHSDYTAIGSSFCTYWGYLGKGTNSSHVNDRDGADSATLRSSTGNDQMPPKFYDSYNDFRLFSAQEFKQQKLPALRFETSCKVELYSESRSGDRFGAYCSYYLDSQIM